MMFQASWLILRETFHKWQADKASDKAAAMAFYAIFSLAPLLLVAVAIVGFVFGPAAAQGQVAEQLKDLIGVQAGQALQHLVLSANQPRSGLLATLIGTAAILIGASGLFVHLQEILNTIWAAPPAPKHGLWTPIRQYLMGFLMTLASGFLLLLSLLIGALLAGLSGYLDQWMPGLNPLWQWSSLAVSFLVATLLFATIFKMMPETRIAWSDVWVGAGVTALLFTLGKIPIGYYLGHRMMSSTYGAAGSLVILLLWIYYSMQILLLGAEFTYVYARHRRRPVPTGELASAPPHPRPA